MSARDLIIEGVQKLLDEHGATAFNEDAQAHAIENDDNPPTASETSPCVGWVVVAVWQDLDDGLTWRFLIDPPKQLDELTAGLISYGKYTQTM